MKVYLTGGDKAGWALDEDQYLTRQALSQIKGIELVASPAECDVIHSVWSTRLLDHSKSDLVGKKVICHMDNSALSYFQDKHWQEYSLRVGRWVPINKQDEGVLVQAGLSPFYIPYSIRTDIFFPKPALKKQLRHSLGLKCDDYVVGNFMRDSLGENITLPKPQKCPELYASILTELKRRGIPVVALLAGPRRHWLRNLLKNANVPFVFIGNEKESDDYPENILPREKLNDLYAVMDVLLVTSRWEGGPRSVLEAAAAACPVLSTPVGLAPDVLDTSCLFSNFSQAVDILEHDYRFQTLRNSLNTHLERVKSNHTVESNIPKFRKLYDQIDTIPIYSVPENKRVTLVPQGGILGKVVRVTKRNLVKRGLLKPYKGKKVVLWHEFHKPPYGGGNQFMLALNKALESKQCLVRDNKPDDDASVHICNSAWFDKSAFEHFAKKHKPIMLHRIDGPISSYRNCGPEKDDEIFALNQQYASVTVIQSWYTYRELKKMGYHPVRPVIIPNGCDPTIFNTKGKIIPKQGEKIKIIATSWSDNPKKGAATLKWLENNLDWGQFELTFVGRTKISFEKAKHISPQNSENLAAIIKEHHIYLTASEKDPCSNALLEALTCGLPAVALNDGGHPELVGFGGLLFNQKEEIPDLLNQIRRNWYDYHQLIRVATIDEIAELYLESVRFY